MADQPGPERSTPPTKGDIAADKARRKAERPWYKKKRFMIPLVLLGLIILGGVLGGEEAADVVTEETGDEDAPEEEDVPEEVPEEVEYSTIGDPARDGNFEFVVTGFECGIHTLGDEFTEVEASGQFCVLTITAENIGNTSQALSADNQYLYDAQERRLNASFEAGLAVESPIFEEVNPGITVEGRVPFDVPADATIEFAELHDSPFSGGVLVDLR